MTDRIALVTGASRGLGFACALEMARRGWHVVALARTTGGLEELADAIDAVAGACTLVPLDITDDGGLQRMARAVHDRWARLDALVHCAIHAAPCAPAQSVAEKDLDRVMAVNIRATQRLITMCDPLLKAAGTGTAVLPVDGHPGQPFFAGYGASKAAQTALWQSWQTETQRIGPRVMLHDCAPMPTALRARFYPGEDRARLASCAGEAVGLVDRLP
jgi:NAD(P)-dependent dehydrogenase (short-subunit alcohol dehydrogenase family)